MKAMNYLQFLNVAVTFSACRSGSRGHARGPGQCMFGNIQYDPGKGQNWELCPSKTQGQCRSARKGLQSSFAEHWSLSVTSVIFRWLLFSWLQGLHRFYENVMQAILRHVNFDVVKCVLIASPGFVRDQFYEFMMQQALKTDNKQLLENKNKFLLLHSSSGFKHSLRGRWFICLAFSKRGIRRYTKVDFSFSEVLSDPSVQSKLADTKAAGEVKALDSFYSLLQNEPARAYYGLKHVEVAHQAQAVETLLITDTLFR